MVGPTTGTESVRGASSFAGWVSVVLLALIWGGFVTCSWAMGGASCSGD